MKSLSAYTGWISLVAVTVLYILYFSRSGSLSSQPFRERAGAGTFRIAYFSIDSLQKYYQEFLDAEEQMKTKETSSKKILQEMNVRYQKRLTQLQEKARAQSMSQAEGEAAQLELTRLENEYRQKDTELDQELKKMQLELMTSLNGKVEDYLKQYNTQKGYAYVFSYQPGMLMYYKDTLYDITQEMIEGLNEQYRKVKKKQ
ncbi:MAG: OmpH family outer membrane protein [Chitinophagaceae bacterium]